jgi:2-deoxy-D-gluconate 3-dehydrogenase
VGAELAKEDVIIVNNSDTVMSLLYFFKNRKDQFLHPVTKALLAAGITPNMVSAAGLFVCSTAGIAAAYGHLDLAVLFFLIGACFDIVDGSLARAGGLEDEFGRYFDSICDRLSEVALVTGAVVGGVNFSAYAVVIGSVILMASRIINHRKGLSSDTALFGRPERVGLLLAGLLLPAPYDIGLFVLAGSLCLISSGQIIAYGMKQQIIGPKIMNPNSKKRIMDKINKLLNLSGKVAIVTGGAVGIGYGISYRFAEAGASVVIATRNEEQGEGAARELRSVGWETTAIRTDVSDEASVKNMVEETVRKYGSIDILVNNAGIYPQIPLSMMTLEDFNKVIAINLDGVFLCTKYVSERMIAQKKGGKIINITSIDALHPSSIGLAHYDASKHGVWGFTKNIALELAPHKIWVNAIAPGGILTPGVQKLQQSMPVAKELDMGNVIEKFLERIPMRRLGDPDDIGKVALFLASNMSSYMTGSQIIVDGGALLE